MRSCCIANSLPKAAESHWCIQLLLSKAGSIYLFAEAFKESSADKKVLDKPLEVLTHGFQHIE